MLLSFSIKNWQSFRDEIEFSMIAGRETRHNDRLIRLKKYKTRVLPIAVLYGANASGKSNFLNAIAFFRSLIITETTETDYDETYSPFLLDSDTKTAPTVLEATFLVHETVYKLAMTIDHTGIIDEILYKIGISDTKVILYHRQKSGITELSPHYSHEAAFLAFTFDIVSPKASLLSGIHQSNRHNEHIDEFKAIYNWFDSKLLVITTPSAQFTSMAITSLWHKSAPSYRSDSLLSILSQLDTGIAGITDKSNPAVDYNGPDALGAEKYSGLPCQYYTSTGGRKQVKTLYTLHTTENGTLLELDARKESDGTKRILNLLPSLEALFSDDNVMIIDEFDKSLHPLIVRSLISLYLDSCHESMRSQLIISTHDAGLLDKTLLRRDELWFTERKDNHGATDLFSLSDFTDLNKNTDLEQYYLQGRLGGVPEILLYTTLTQTRLR